MREEEIAHEIKSDLLIEGADFAILTEDMDDILFWKDVFELALPQKKVFFANQHWHKAAGKSSLQTYHSFVDEKLVICQDSDSEFLWTDNRRPNQTPFIYETYVYSVENYCLYPTTLSKLIFDITLVEYELESFFEAYTHCVGDLFYLWVYAKKYNIEAIDTLLNKKQLIKLLPLELGRFDSLEDEPALFKDLTHRIEEHFEEIKLEIGEEWFEGIMKDELPALKNSLEKNWAIQQANIIQFLRGHTMFDDVFLPFLDRLIQLLKQRKSEELVQTYSHKPEQEQEEKQNQYVNRTNKDLQTKLLENYRPLLAHPDTYLQTTFSAIHRDFPKVS